MKRVTFIMVRFELRLLFCFMQVQALSKYNIAWIARNLTPNISLCVVVNNYLSFPWLFFQRILSINEY